MSAELHALVGAYALDALDHREQLAFEGHLAGCPICSDELVEFRTTVERLGVAVASPPPPELRAELLGLVTRTPQDRPLVSLANRARWRHRAPVLLAAACLMAAVGAVGAYIGEHDRASDLVAADEQKAAVLAADDATTASTRKGGTTLRVWSSESVDSAVVVMGGVPELRPSSSYQLWAIQRGELPESVAVMDQGDVDAGASVLIPDLDDTTTVAVTVEPEGGSEQPTTEPVLSVELA